MNYLTKYYKNLSEELQAQVNLLEAGFKKALRVGLKNPEMLAKTLAAYRHKLSQAKAESQRHQALVDRAEEEYNERGGYNALNRSYDAESDLWAAEDRMERIEANTEELGRAMSEKAKSRKRKAPRKK